MFWSTFVSSAVRRWSVMPATFLWWNEVHSITRPVIHTGLLALFFAWLCHLIATLHFTVFRQVPLCLRFQRTRTTFIRKQCFWSHTIQFKCVMCFCVNVSIVNVLFQWLSDELISENDPSAVQCLQLGTLYLVLSSTVTLSLYFKSRLKTHLFNSLPVPPAPLKLRHYGTLQIYYYYYCYYYYYYLLSDCDVDAFCHLYNKAFMYVCTSM